MQILFRVVPVAQRDDDVALDTGRTYRFCPRQLALGNPFGPVGQIRKRHAAELAGSDQHHVFAGLSGLNAAHPGVAMRFAGKMKFRDRARCQLTKLVTANAAVVLHRVQIISELDVRRRFLAAEGAGIRQIHHRIPVDCRVNLGSGRFVRRNHGFQIELLARRAFDFRRIDESVTAHPDVVGGFRQIGYDISALIVGDDALDIAHRQLPRFGNHPDAGFRPIGAAHHAADVVIVNGDWLCLQ